MDQFSTIDRDQQAGVAGTNDAVEENWPWPDKVVSVTRGYNSGEFVNSKTAQRKGVKIDNFRMDAEISSVSRC